MCRKTVFGFILCFIFLNAGLGPVYACEVCTIPRLGKNTDTRRGTNRRWSAEYLLEYQNWHEKEAGEAHQLHHQGHHFHDKTDEYIHHINLTGLLSEDWTLQVDIPYVFRRSIEIDTHSILGTRQNSEGLGDVHVTGLYRFWKDERASARFIGGVKFPSGQTHEKNSAGIRFEPELQPGTGSFDFLLGGAYQKESGAFVTTANLIYVFKTEGAQGYEFGDLVTTSLLCEYRRPVMKEGLLKLGVDANIQYEQRHKSGGDTVKDGGGFTFLLGPAVMLEFSPLAAVFTTVHLPVIQDLGGVHQQLDYMFNAGARFSW